MAVPGPNLFNQLKESLETLDAFLAGNQFGQISPEEYPKIYGRIKPQLDIALDQLPNNPLLIKVGIIINKLEKLCRNKTYTNADILGYSNQLKSILAQINTLEEKLSSAVVEEDRAEAAAQPAQPTVADEKPKGKQPPKPLPRIKREAEKPTEKSIEELTVKNLTPDSSSPQVNLNNTPAAKKITKINKKNIVDYINKLIKKKKGKNKERDFGSVSAYDDVKKALNIFNRELEKCREGKYDLHRAKKLQAAYFSLESAFVRIDQFGFFSDKQLSTLQNTQLILERFENEITWDIKQVVQASREVDNYNKIKHEYEGKIQKLQQEVKDNPSIFLSKKVRKEMAEIDGLYQKMLVAVKQIYTVRDKIPKGDFKNELEKIAKQVVQESGRFNAEYQAYQQWLATTNSALAGILAAKINADLSHVIKLINKTKALSPDIARECDKMLAEVKDAAKNYLQFVENYQKRNDASPQEWMNRYDAVMVKFAYIKNSMEKINKGVVKLRKTPEYIASINSVSGLIAGFQQYLADPARNYEHDARLQRVLLALNKILQLHREGKFSASWQVLISRMSGELTRLQQDLDANRQLLAGNKNQAIYLLDVINAKMVEAKHMASPEEPEKIKVQDLGKQKDRKKLVDERMKQILPAAVKFTAEQSEKITDMHAMLFALGFDEIEEKLDKIVNAIYEASRYGIDRNELLDRLHSGMDQIMRLSQDGQFKEKLNKFVSSQLSSVASKLNTAKAVMRQKVEQELGGQIGLSQALGQASLEGEQAGLKKFNRSAALFDAFSALNTNVVGMRDMEEVDLTFSKVNTVWKKLEVVPGVIEKLEYRAKQIEAIDQFFREFKGKLWDKFYEDSSDEVKAELDRIAEIHRQMVTSNLTDGNLDKLIASFHDLMLKNIDVYLLIMQSKPSAGNWETFDALLSILKKLEVDAGFAIELNVRLQPYKQDFQQELSATDAKHELIERLNGIISAPPLIYIDSSLSQAVKAEDPNDRFKHNEFVKGLDLQERALKARCVQLLCEIESSGADKTSEFEKIFMEYEALKKLIEKENPEKLIDELQELISSMNSMVSKCNRLSKSPIVREQHDAYLQVKQRVDELTNRAQQLSSLLKSLNVGDLKNQDNRLALYEALTRLPNVYKNEAAIKTVLNILQNIDLYSSLDKVLAIASEHPESKPSIKQFLQQLPDNCFNIKEGKTKDACIDAVLADPDLALFNFTDNANKYLTGKYILVAQQQIKQSLSGIIAHIKQDKSDCDTALKSTVIPQDNHDKLASLVGDAQSMIERLTAAKNKLIYFYYPDTTDANGRAVSGPSYDANGALRDAQIEIKAATEQLQEILRQYPQEQAKTKKFVKASEADHEHAAKQMHEELGLKLFERRKIVDKGEQQSEPTKKTPTTPRK